MAIYIPAQLMHSPRPLSNETPPLLQQSSVLVGRVKGVVAPPAQFSCSL